MNDAPRVLHISHRCNDTINYHLHLVSYIKKPILPKNGVLIKHQFFTILPQNIDGEARKNHPIPWCISNTFGMLVFKISSQINIYLCVNFFIISLSILVLRLIGVIKISRLNIYHSQRMSLHLEQNILDYIFLF
jgi:hypothetical protein